MAFSVMQKMMGGLKDVPQKMMKGLKDVPQKIRNAANNFAESGGRAISRNTQAFWDGSSPMRQAGRKNQMFLDQYGPAYAESRKAGTATRGGRRGFRLAQERADRKGLSLFYPRDRNAEQVAGRLRVARRNGPAGRRVDDRNMAWTKDGYKDIVKPARVTTGNRPYKGKEPFYPMVHVPGKGTSSTPAAAGASGGVSQLLANAGAGALAGGVVGGLNPMGDDGMLTGAVKGAALGGLMGAAAGHFGRGLSNTATKGNHTASIGKGRASYSYAGGESAREYGASLATLGGAAGGLIGGSGKKKRNTVIQSNSWSQGTHPQYFGG